MTDYKVNNLLVAVSAASPVFLLLQISFPLREIFPPVLRDMGLRWALQVHLTEKENPNESEPEETWGSAGLPTENIKESWDYNFKERIQQQGQ